MNKDDIAKLTPSERVAGYLHYSTKLAILGASLCKNNRKDEVWTQGEEKAWNAISDELDDWWYALTEKDRAFVKSFQDKISHLTNAEYGSNAYCLSCKKELPNTDNIPMIGGVALCCPCYQQKWDVLIDAKIANIKPENKCVGCEKHHWWLTESSKIRKVIAK